MKLLALLALLSVSANCGASMERGTAPASPTSGLPGVETVQVDGPRFVFWQSSSSFHARVTLSTGETLVPDKVSWSSSAPAVARVDAGGIVRGLSNGQATISASMGGKSAGVSVRVLPDYRGSWVGTLTQPVCRGFYCNPAEILRSKQVELLLDQDGASLAGRLLEDPQDYIDDRRGYLMGHVDDEGSMVVDRGLLDKWGNVDIMVYSWRADIGADGHTMSGNFVRGLVEQGMVNLRRIQ